MTLPILGPNERLPGEDPETNARGQFRIKCPDGKARWYTRCTTFIKVLDDRSMLEAWKNRVLLVGLWADRSLIDELTQLNSEHLSERGDMNKLVDRIFRAGDGYLKAEKGTRLHELTEHWDKLEAMPDLTPVEETGLRNYADLCEHFGIEHLYRERRVVIDDLKVTGTPDSVARYTCLDGVTRNVISDLKTKPGEFSFGRGEVAQQEAMYAAGELYTDDGSPTGLREPLPDISRSVGLMIHVPQDNSCPSVLYEVDLRMGWHLVQLSKEVRAARNYGKKVFWEVPRH